MASQLIDLAKKTGKSFSEDRGTTVAGAIAFFTALAFPPLVVLLVTIGGLLGEGTRENLLSFFQSNVGPQAAQVTESVIEQQSGAQTQGGSILGITLSILFLLFSASLVFAQLQAALNYIWGVEAAKQAGVWNIVRKRLLSMGMILAMFFILLVAMVVSSVLDQLLNAGSGVSGWALSFLVSLLVYSLLLAVIFKYLPDVRMAWGPVWLGAGLTALLFAIGQVAVSIYMRYSGVGESYGQAAGSLLAMLVWVYYSAIMFLLGAEATKVVTLHRRVPVRTTAHSRWRDAARAPAGQPA